MSDDTQAQPMRFFSYSRSAADENCQRERYLSREWGGTGLQATGPASWALVFGNLFHAGAEELAKTGKINFLSYRLKAVVEAQLCGYDIIAARDWGTNLEGLLRGFVLNVWPQLMAEYEILDTEGWITYACNDRITFRARQDLLLKNKFDGHVCYVDYKTTSSIKPQWIKSWNKSAQLHSSMLAMRKSSGIPVDRAIVIGAYKGYKDDKNNTQRSAFSHGYVNREFGMTPQYSYEYQRNRGWELFSTFEEFDSLEEWVDRMPTSKVSEYFPRTGPIFLREDIAEEWFAQRLLRESEVDAALAELHSVTSAEDIQRILRTHFPQNYSKCEPAYGFGCEFEQLCWRPWVQADPIASGLFKRYEADYGELS